MYSKDATAIKIHYMMIQIAHIIRQLLENGLREVKELKLKLKEISQIITKELISTITNLKVHYTTQPELILKLIEQLMAEKEKNQTSITIRRIQKR